MYPAPLPDRPSQSIKASIAAGAALLALLGMLLYVGYEPIAGLGDPAPVYLSAGKARDLETLARDAGLPFRTGLQELVQTASGRDELFTHARMLEDRANAALAVRVYQVNARSRHGKSALRLAELYDRGAPGVGRDYSESLQWYETARQLGERVETCCKR